MIAGARREKNVATGGGQRIDGRLDRLGIIGAPGRRNAGNRLFGRIGQDHGAGVFDFHDAAGQRRPGDDSHPCNRLRVGL